MEKSERMVSIPVPPNFANLVVFPAPSKESDESWFYLLKNTDSVPVHGLSNVSVRYIPGSVYCFLPSEDENKGKVSFYSQKPAFLDEFIYCLEINKKVIQFQDKVSQPVFNPQAKVETDLLRCATCFSSHFPRPNTILCKGTKSNRNGKRMSTPKFYPVRLRGGAGPRGTMLEKAMMNGRIHGINLHPGVENLANGNCAFECIIDTINTNDIFEETLDGTPDYWRDIWMGEVEKVAYENWNNGLTLEEWKKGWEVLRCSRTYECQL